MKKQVHLRKKSGDAGRKENERKKKTTQHTNLHTLTHACVNGCLTKAAKHESSDDGNKTPQSEIQIVFGRVSVCVCVCNRGRAELNRTCDSLCCC